MMQQAFQGRPDEHREMADFGSREMAAMLLMMVALLWLGVYPQTLFDLTQPVIDGLMPLASEPAANLASLENEVRP